MGNESLDILASGGVINFDADAFVNGTSPRFVGKPEGNLYLPFDRPLPALPDAGEIKAGNHLKGHPDADAFISKEKEHKPISWKAVLTGILAGALALFGASKIGKIKPFMTELGKKISPAFEAVKNKFSSWFKKASEAASAAPSAPAAETVAEETAPIVSKIKPLLEKFSKHGKITAAGAAGLLGLYGLYQVLKPHKKQQPNPEQPEAHH